MDQLVHRGAARSSGALGRFGALWGGAVRRAGSQLRSGAFWGVLARSGMLWGALRRSRVLWGVLGRSGALWGVLGHSGVYSGTECVIYTALPASLVSFYWFLQYTLGVLLNGGTKPTAPQAGQQLGNLCGIYSTFGIRAHFVLFPERAPA